VTNHGGLVIEMLGKTFGRLTVVRHYGLQVDCICECGKLKTTTSYNLRSSRAVSCGCYRQQTSAATSFKHGMTGNPTWMSWTSMKARCTNPKIHNSKSYFDKGITYDPAWEDFNEFLRDMGERPEGTTLDRKENSKGYYKENCRWATSREQWLNRDDPRIQKHFQNQVEIALVDSDKLLQELL
jgi:hypothetical protein